MAKEEVTGQDNPSRDYPVDERAQELARRVMHIPPKPKTKPKEDRVPSSKPGKSEPTGEAS